MKTTYWTTRLAWMVFTSSDPCRLVVIPWLEFFSHFFDYLFSFFSLTIIGISYKVKKCLRHISSPSPSFMRGIRGFFLFH